VHAVPPTIMMSRSDGSHRRLGASSIEYSLLVALIAISMLVTLALVGDRLSALFTISLPGSPLGDMQALYGYLDNHNCGNGNGSLVAAEWSDHYYQVCEECMDIEDLNAYFYAFDGDTTGELEQDEWNSFCVNWIENYEPI
jgi:hypothetical protein